MTYPNVYATQTGPLALSGLDANFLYAVDIANGALSATAGGTADAITATYSPAPAALVAGLTLYVRAASANATTTPQFSPNGLTGKVIVKNNNQALAVGDIAGAGHWLHLVYDATNGVWELMNSATFIGAVQTGGTANGVAYLNASKVLTTGIALTFDGTNLLVGVASANANGGVLQLKSGITFPATQVAATDANTLDDYEESTWTPTLAFGGASVGITYTASYNTASVTKIGSRVFVSGITSLTSKGTSTGNASLTSLPFPADGIKAFSAVACSLTGVTFTGQYAMELDANADVVYFYQVSALGVQSALTNTNFANTSAFLFNFSYFTTA